MTEPVHWTDDGLSILDQTLLPTECRFIRLSTATQVWEAIYALRVRGAPAIGICAAYGVVAGFREKAAGRDDLFAVVDEVADYLVSSRPTAVNLFWAAERLKQAARRAQAQDAQSVEAVLLEEAHAIQEEERERCRTMGDYGAELIADGDSLITHCNTGPLATGAYGSALAAPIRAHELGKRVHVYADETRPLLQGARLTTWELMNAGVPVTLICDNAAAHVLREGRVQMAIVGADRIAANGDTANKIGTYHLALACAAHDVPFYVAAPFSTFDMELPDGGHIPIEERAAEEVTHGFGRQTAPDGVKVYNPAFDVTPARLIAGIVTERGVLRAPFEESIRQLQAHYQQPAPAQ